MANLTNGEFEKRKTRDMGNQQIAGIHFNDSDLYAPVLKAREGRLLAAIVAKVDVQIYKYDMSQVFLYGDVDKTAMLERQIGDLSWFLKDTACS
jgi:hypothetical protein